MEILIFCSPVFLFEICLLSFQSTSLASLGYTSSIELSSSELQTGFFLLLRAKTSPSDRPIDRSFFLFFFLSIRISQKPLPRTAITVVCLEASVTSEGSEGEDSYSYGHIGSVLIFFYM